MKKIILISLIAVILSSCSKTKTEHWPNGNKKSELKYYSGKLDGLSTWWYEDGVKQMECNYKNDLLEGKTTRWNFNGNLQSEDIYVANHLNGKSVSYFESGNKKAEKNYVNDTLDGPVTEWHENGKIKMTGFYKKGMYHGNWEYRELSGIIVGDGKFNNGTGIQRGYYPEGKIMREIHYENNKKNGPEIWYDKAGDTAKKIVYKDDRIVL